MSEPTLNLVRPLTECTPEDLEDGHAFVFGRCKVWEVGILNNERPRWWWSKETWWKGHWYPHRGLPSLTHSWHVAGGFAGLVHTGNVGDAELTHFMRMPPNPNKKESSA